MHICKPGALSLHGHAPKLCKSAPCWFYCSLRQEANSMDEVPPVERSDTRRTLVTSIVRLDKAPKELRYRTEAKRSMNILLPTIGRICPNILFGWLRLAWFSLIFSIFAGIGAWTRRGQKMKTPAERDQRSKRPSTDRMFRTIRVHLVFLPVQGFKRSWRTLKKISGCFNTPCMEIHWPKRICRLCTLGGHVHWLFTRCCTCMQEICNVSSSGGGWGHWREAHGPWLNMANVFFWLSRWQLPGRLDSIWYIIWRLCLSPVCSYCCCFPVKIEKHIL